MAPQPESQELTLLRQLFANLPRCNYCKGVATLQGSYVNNEGVNAKGATCDVAVIMRVCDQHLKWTNTDNMEDMPYAEQVRLLTPSKPKARKTKG